MSQWTDRHYNYTYKLTDRDIIAGEIRVDAYFVAKVWKTGSKDDSGALWHCLKTIARFGDKNDVEREIKALYAQVKGLARSFDVELETAEDEGFSIPSHTGEEIAVQYVNKNTTKEVDESVDNTHPYTRGWIAWDGTSTPPNNECFVEVKFRSGNSSRRWRVSDLNWEHSSSDRHYDIVAYKVVE